MSMYSRAIHWPAKAGTPNPAKLTDPPGRVLVEPLVEPLAEHLHREPCREPLRVGARSRNRASLDATVGSRSSRSPGPGSPIWFSSRFSRWFLGPSWRVPRQTTSRTLPRTTSSRRLIPGLRASLAEIVGASSSRSPGPGSPIWFSSRFSDWLDLSRCRRLSLDVVDSREFVFDEVFDKALE